MICAGILTWSLGPVKIRYGLVKGRGGVSPRRRPKYLKDPGYAGPATTTTYKGMDAAFVPTEIAVKHTHKIILEFGPSITALGRPIRNLLIGAAVIYCMTGLVRGTLQAVLKPQGSK